MTVLLAGVGLGLLLVAAPVRAQTAGPQQPASIAAAARRLPPRATVFITEANARRVEGTLIEVTAAGLRVESGGEIRLVEAGDVRVLEWQRPDSLWNGVLVGAGIGAIPGIYWLIADPNECGGMCPEELALIGIGAAAGGLIDRLISKKVTVFRSGGPESRGATLAVGPWASRDGRGVRVTVRF
jgi:hypothetical protein